MMSKLSTEKLWVTAAELAERFDVTLFEIEALARRHHWPRVNRERSTLIDVNVETVQRALGKTPSKVHGSIPPK